MLPAAVRHGALSTLVRTGSGLSSHRPRLTHRLAACWLVTAPFTVWRLHSPSRTTGKRRAYFWEGKACPALPRGTASIGMSDPALQPTCRSGGLSFSEILSPPVMSPRSQWPSPLFGFAQAFHHFLTIPEQTMGAAWGNTASVFSCKVRSRWSGG